MTHRVLIAPDKFKGTLSADQAAAAISAGVLRAAPDSEIRLVPVADGGDGTVAAVIAAGAEPLTTVAHDPLGRPVTARWARFGRTAVIELAAASGLVLINPSDSTARAADSFGTGEVILTALDSEPDTIILGLGGSATSDGGSGLLRALGARFLDSEGTPIPAGGAGLNRLARVDLSGLDPRLQHTPIVVCCDVVSPLTGPSGAAHIFGPQKGASPKTVIDLDHGLARLAEVLTRTTGRDPSTLPWGGAAGGTSGGLYGALGASFQSGIEKIAELLDLDAHLAWANVAFIGEGSLDHQSLAGKAPIGVAHHARALGVPVLAVAGRVQLEPQTLLMHGITAAAALTDLADPRDSLSDATKWTAVAAENLMSGWVTSVGGALSADTASSTRSTP